MVITIGVIAYAWVSLATINNIDGIGLTASAGDDLQISIDGQTFYNSLPREEIQELFEGVTLYDATTLDNINFYTGGLRGHNEAIPNFHYVSFDLWLRSTRPERAIYLYNNVNDLVDYYNYDKLGTFVISRGVYWMSNETFFNGPLPEDTVNVGSIDQYYASDAMRIGIRELRDNLNPLDNRTNDEFKNIIYDPSENYARGYGVTFGMLSYFNKRARLYLFPPTTFPNTTYRLSEMDPQNPYQALNNDSQIATLQETELISEEDERTYYQAKIRINIWVEGWDADAFDAIGNDQIRIQLQFKLANPANE
jgi:hypothetical protein